MARYIDIEKAEYPYMSMSMFGINSKDCRIYNEGVKATEDMIQALPTADVEVVRHGEWAVNVGMNFNKERICPICKKKVEGNYWNYCSNCGAKMDRGKAE